MTLPSWAQQVEVDLELVLAVDVSRSMSAEELEIQRRGYAAALTSDEVWEAIRGGMIGRVAITYMEWAGSLDQRIVVPWTLIETREDAAAFADRITAHFDGAMRRTSISGGLKAASIAFEVNDFIGLRRVIDISGDGPNNQGRPVLPARSDVLAQGIVINGLPLMTQDEFSERFGIPDLDAYYTNCVIGGPGAFMLPVWSWEDFEPTLRRKLVLELAGLAPTQPRIIQADAYDCMIGEKIWERYFGDWYSP
ncbi:MAG: DUF1194 domain-containing protein [Paracoccaceae bacterium]